MKPSKISTIICLLIFIGCFINCGGVYYDDESDAYYVHAVRGGRSGSLDNFVIIAVHSPTDGASEVTIDTVITVTLPSINQWIRHLLWKLLP